MSEASFHKEEASVIGVRNNLNIWKQADMSDSCFSPSVFALRGGPVSSASMWATPAWSNQTAAPTEPRASPRVGCCLPRATPANVCLDSQVRRHCFTPFCSSGHLSGCRTCFNARGRTWMAFWGLILVAGLLRQGHRVAAMGGLKPVLCLCLQAPTLITHKAESEPAPGLQVHNCPLPPHHSEDKNKEM